MTQQYIGTIRPGTTQSVSYTGTAGTITSGMSTGVAKVRVVTTTDALVAVGKTASAAATDMYCVALTPEYFSIMPGEKVSAVQVSAAGTLFVTEAV